MHERILPQGSALQVLVRRCEGPLSGGIPAAVRGADRAAEELSPGLIAFEAPEDFGRRWSRQLKRLGKTLCSPQALTLLNPERPLLVLEGSGFPEDGGLTRSIGGRLDSRPLEWFSGSRRVAAYWPAGWDAQRVVSSSPGAQKAFESWRDASTPESAAQAERWLCGRLPRETDGYLARFDRKVSIALSRLLLPWPVTPNHITTLGLILGLGGSLALASGSYGARTAGALVLWFCCILDGCDGEVARLKLLGTPRGAAYDLAADYVVHLATFAALPVGVYRAHPGFRMMLPAVLLLSGMVAAMVGVHVLTRRESVWRHGPLTLFIERVASRDYVYLIVLFVLADRLDWLVWAAGIGAHVFNVMLWWTCRGAVRIRTPSTA